MARVLGWGSSCDDDTHLPQLLERFERASTKMLDRWSVMVFERGEPALPPTASAYRTPKMSICQADSLLLQFEDSIMWHLQTILDNEDRASTIQSSKILCESVTDIVTRINDYYVEDEQLNIKCDILRWVVFVSLILYLNFE